MSNFNRDLVYSPTHYKAFDFENMDLMREILKENMYAVYVYNFLKYLIRYEFKDMENDLEKANFFLCEIIKFILNNKGKNIVLSLEQLRNINDYITKISKKNSYLSQIIRMFMSVFLNNEIPRINDIKFFEKDFFIFCMSEKERLRSSL